MATLSFMLIEPGIVHMHNTEYYKDELAARIREQSWGGCSHASRLTPLHDAHEGNGNKHPLNAMSSSTC